MFIKSMFINVDGNWVSLLNGAVITFKNNNGDYIRC